MNNPFNLSPAPSHKKRKEYSVNSFAVWLPGGESDAAVRVFSGAPRGDTVFLGKGMLEAADVTGLGA
jgi:hypothetical protein